MNNNGTYTISWKMYYLNQQPIRLKIVNLIKSIRSNVNEALSMSGFLRKGNIFLNVLIATLSMIKLDDNVISVGLN